MVSKNLIHDFWNTHTKTDQHNYWRASVASETLTGVTQLKIGDVCLFIYIYVWTYVCHFGTGSNAERTQKYGGSVFAPRSTPSQFTKQNPPV